MGANHKMNIQNKLQLSLFFTASLALAGCTSMGGDVKKDTSLTDQTEKLEKAGAEYNGPAYTIGIITLANKTPSKVIGIGEAATDILRTSLKQAGLEPIMLTEDELQQHDKMIELQQAGVVKTGKKDAAEGMDSIDFRVSGTITSYSELEEGSNMLLTSSKTQVARVGVDYALVDIASGRTLVAKSGQGEYHKTTRKVLGMGDTSSADTSLRDGALRDAMNKAVESMIKELSERPFTSRIILVDGGTVIFRGGTRSKLDTGARLAVYRAGKELVDPDSGRVLGVREDKIGEIKLASHQNESVSQGSVVNGNGFKRGDILKLIK
jgi:curli biogenesis system outer membrane secretion channel CsgG